MEKDRGAIKYVNEEATLQVDSLALNVSADITNGSGTNHPLSLAQIPRIEIIVKKEMGLSHYVSQLLLCNNR